MFDAACFYIEHCFSGCSSLSDWSHALICVNIIKQLMLIMCCWNTFTIAFVPRSWPPVSISIARVSTSVRILSQQQTGCPVVVQIATIIAVARYSSCCCLPRAISANVGHQRRRTVSGPERSQNNVHRALNKVEKPTQPMRGVSSTHCSRVKANTVQLQSLYSNVLHIHVNKATSSVIR